MVGQPGLLMARDDSCAVAMLRDDASKVIAYSLLKQRGFRGALCFGLCEEASSR